jgi:hypothetical protein
MNKPNLSEIFRSGTRNADGVLDADAIIALANGQSTTDADGINASAAHRDLIRFARELETESAALSSDVTAALRAAQPAHRRNSTSQRATHGQRHWRIASALAASFVAAIAIWSSHRITSDAHQSHLTASVQSSDRIFTAFDDRAMANNVKRGDDHIFRNDFRPDEIFNARHNDG